MAADAAKVTLLVFAAALAQVTVFASMALLGGSPDLLLVTLVAIALLRGAITGAAAGFAAGLLVDTANLETLGLTSLVLSVAGYWTGRYGETSGRVARRANERGSQALAAVQPSRNLGAHAPLMAVLVVTALYSVAAYALHFVLGDHVSARLVLLDALLPAILWNLLLTVPVYAVVRRVLPLPMAADRAREVNLVA
jgi:cell shape-determining protein MreD